ncbi:MAG TPA: protein kinase [Acidimicrobiales bacterium]
MTDPAATGLAAHSPPAGDPAAPAARPTTVRAERRAGAGDPVGYRGPVALKPILDASPGRVAELRRRWEALRAVDHPHLARVVEVFRGPPLFRGEPPGAAEGEAWYAAAAWVEGRTLGAAAPLAPAEAIGVAHDLAGALSALHARGVVHRDVHPGNVVLGAGGAVLIDFGSARPDDGRDTATVAGALGFIAPECLQGAGRAAADGWALGMLLVFALLGHPRGSTPPDALRRELVGALRDIADPGRALRLIDRLLDPDPAARPADLCAWADELRGCLTRRPWWPRRGALGAAALGLLATTAVAGAVAAGAVVAGAAAGSGAEPGDAGTDSRLARQEVCG